MRGLYAIVDPEQCQRHTPVDLALAVLRGGCAALQLRAKLVSDADYLLLARPILAACRERGVPFVVNDRLDAALALGAEGLHLGQDDLPIESAHARFGGQVGISTHSLEQAERAWSRGADLIGFGPVFPTGSKRGADPVVGLDGLRAVCAQARGPVVAIGGIRPEQLDEVLAAGADCVAVIGALSTSGDPEGTARHMHGRILSRARA